MNSDTTKLEEELKTENNPSFLFLDDINEENVTQEIWVSINKLFSRLSHLVNYKYHLILYRLLKKGYVKPGHLAEVSGFSEQRLYNIVKIFEQREVEREEVSL